MQVVLPRIKDVEPTSAISEAFSSVKRGINMVVDKNAKQYLTDARVGRMTSKLVNMIKESGEEFDLIIGIERGGTIITMTLADRLNLPYDLERIKSDYKTDGSRNPPMLVNAMRASSIKGLRILVVDDLADKGDTFSFEVDRLMNLGAAKVKSAALMTKPWSKFTPDFFAAKTKRWVVFPWEKGETKRESLETEPV